MQLSRKHASFIKVTDAMEVFQQTRSTISIPRQGFTYRDFDANRDFNFKLGRLGIVALTPFIAPNVRKILVGHEPLPRKRDERHSGPTYLSRQDL